MIKYFRKPLDFILFSNIFISLGALAQGLVTYHLLNVAPSYLVLAFLFLSTLVTYNLSILIYKPKNWQQSKYRRVRWIFRNYRLNLFLTIAATVALIPVFFFLSLKVKVLSVLLGILSLGYALPIIKYNGKKYGLRSIPGLKLFLIAFVWACSSVLIPFLNQSEFNYSTSNIIILVLKRFLFVVAITIPFDIRDMFQDKVFSLKTIPTLFGERKAYLLCQLMLAVYIILLFLFRNKGFDADFIALTATVVLTGWLIFKSKWERNEYYYFFYLDGTLILQYAMLILVNILV